MLRQKVLDEIYRKYYTSTKLVNTIFYVSSTVNCLFSNNQIEKSLDHYKYKPVHYTKKKWDDKCYYLQNARWMYDARFTRYTIKRVFQDVRQSSHCPVPQTWIYIQEIPLNIFHKENPFYTTLHYGPTFLH